MLNLSESCKSEKSTVSALSLATGLQTGCHTVSSEVRTFPGECPFSFSCLETCSTFTPSFFQSWYTTRWTKALSAMQHPVQREAIPIPAPASKPPQLAVPLPAMNLTCSASLCAFSTCWESSRIFLHAVSCFFEQSKAASGYYQSTFLTASGHFGCSLYMF